VEFHDEEIENRDPVDKWTVHLDGFAALEPGWDSYRAAPPSKPTIEAARVFLEFLQKRESLPDKLNPSVVGGIGFTFRRGGRSVHVEFRNTGNAHAAFMEAGPKPRVVRVNQDQTGFTELMVQAEKHLDEQPASACRDAS
jgi:hypothetical protein